MSRTARITLTRKGRRYASLMKLSDADLICLGNTYALVGRIPRKPEHLYDRQAVIESIVSSDCGPALRAIRGRAA